MSSPSSRRLSIALGLACALLALEPAAQPLAPSKTTAPAAGSSAPAALATNPASTGSASTGAASTNPANGSAPADLPVRVLLQPARETTLVAQTIGRIDRIVDGVGASFPLGATLVAFDCSEQDARLRMAEAESRSAIQQHDAKLRLQSLQAAGDVEVALAQTAVERARAQIELSRTQIRQCRIEAPFAGRVVKQHVRQFQGVNTGQPLLDIVSSGPPRLRLNVPSRWLNWLKPGTRFEITVDETGKRYPASIVALNGRVDPVSQSLEVEARLNGTFAELLPGMSGNARFKR